VTRDDLTQAGRRGDQGWPHPSRMPRWPKMTSPKPDAEVTKDDLTQAHDIGNTECDSW